MENKAMALQDLLKLVRVVYAGHFLNGTLRGSVNKIIGLGHGSRLWVSKEGLKDITVPATIALHQNPTLMEFSGSTLDPKLHLKC